ncbi:MAG TPA: hypothetical protein VFP74_14045 [Pseudolabrys sp.]|nr:hypothetical protein [Pseudolabrys sp.]
MTSDQAISCPSCGKPMRLRQVLPSFGREPELRTYECVSCSVVKTQKVDS